MFQDKDISVFFDSLKILDSKDVVYSLTKKLEIEKISQYFTITKDYHFKSDLLAITPDNSILLCFKTLHKEYPDYYNSKVFKLL